MHCARMHLSGKLQVAVQGASLPLAVRKPKLAVSCRVPFGNTQLELTVLPQAETLNTPDLYLYIMANPPTNIVDFRGFDSSKISIQRGRIPRAIGHFPESLSQAMLVGIM